jgi:two-component system chemotaxis response regulator CheB
MVVDDSVVVRGLVSRWLNAIPEIDIVSSHRNGALAVADVLRSNPDVVVLDIEMPEMDGLTALPKLLEAKPGLKVIMASTLTRRNAEISLRALSLGATDYIAKPESNHGITTSQDFQRELVDKVKALGGAARPAVRPRALGGASAATSLGPTDDAEEFTLRPFKPVVPKILVVGSSTGGPQALLAVMKSIAPAIDRLPVVITQHMPETFTAILAGHIATATGRVCKEADHNEVLVAGQIYVAPGGFHLRLDRLEQDFVAKLDEGAPINYCRPSVDPLFETATSLCRNAVLALVLTGMGHDGSDGALAIANSGGNVIAQDKATSVVWGMPGAAAMSGACCAVLPLDEIGPRLVRAIGGRA